MNRPPPIFYLIEREDVRSGNIRSTKEFLDSLIASEDVASLQFQNIDLAFNGFDDDREEVFENDHVRAYVQKLDREFPYWLYFMNPFCPGLYAIAMCLMTPCLTDEAKKEVHPQQLKDLLANRWVPALYHIGQWTGMTESALDVIAARSVDYFIKGHQKPNIVN